MFARKRFAVLALQIVMFYGTMDTPRLSQMQRMTWTLEKSAKTKLHALFLSLFPPQICVNMLPLSPPRTAKRVTEKMPSQQWHKYIVTILSLSISQLSPAFTRQRMYLSGCARLHLGSAFIWFYITRNLQQACGYRSWWHEIRSNEKHSCGSSSSPTSFLCVRQRDSRGVWRMETQLLEVNVILQEPMLPMRCLSALFN